MEAVAGVRAALRRFHHRLVGEAARADVERPDAGRTEQPLVGRERHQVGGQGVDVDRYAAGGLRRVEQEEGAVAAGQAAHRRRVLHRAEDVRGVGHHHQPGVGPQRALDLRRVDAAGGVEADPRQLDAAGAGQRLQRTAHRVVLEVGGDDVERPRLAAGDALDGEVQGVGAVEGEDQAAGVVDAQQAGQPVAYPGHQRLGLDRHAMAGAAGVGRRLVEKARHRRRHSRRLGEAGGGVVQVDGGAAAGPCGALSHRRTWHRCGGRLPVAGCP